jgi:RNA-directed DNA polymerase
MFIEDSYACRTGKGTHYGIGRVEGFITACSAGHTRDCHILKLDVQGFFMHIDRRVLMQRLEAFIMERYRLPDRDLVLGLCRTIVYCDPAKDCHIKGSREDWDGLPRNKSLFHSPEGCGLPIGNLTSQVFANFYMHHFDLFMREQLGFAHYGRYVDDFIIVHRDRDVLKTAVPRIAAFLHDDLGLTLHPHKVYLQHCSKGVQFLGTVLRPGRRYAGRRVKNGFARAITLYNRKSPTDDAPALDRLLSSVNSYLGILGHASTYRLRRKLLGRLSAGWYAYCRASDDMGKLVRKRPVSKKKVSQSAMPLMHETLRNRK